MFDKRTKAITWILTFVMAFLFINPVNAVRDHDPLITREEEIIAELRGYRNGNQRVLRKINRVLNKMERERYRWSPCLLDGETGIYGIENGHSELYCLWLVEKLDRIVGYFNEENSIFWKLYDFMSSLLEFVKEKEPVVYFLHEKSGCTAAQIRGCLVKIPGRYDFMKMRKLHRLSLGIGL